MIRKLRFLFTATALIAALSFVLTGCELEEDTDATDTANPPTDTAGGNDTNVEPTGQDYVYVRIDDLSTTSASEDGGADIDAIILDKVGAATSLYADSVEGFAHGGIPGLEYDPTQVTGAPDAFESYPDVSTCRVDGGFVSLGGSGGHLIVHMAGAIEQGDQLTVLEVGNCEWDDNGTPKQAFEDEVEVWVSVAAEIDNSHWVSLGDGGGSPDVSFTIPALPVVPLGQ